ncbi:MAG: hypothetical protein HPY50_01275 [Firmicutes bacterium]|nr:hypothetical protein [Bacillota bacterium]
MTVREEENLVQNNPQRSKARGAAFILSLIPGGGYMYLGLMNRGLQTMLIFVGTIFLSNLLNLDALAGLVIPVLMLYTIFDTQQLWSELTLKGQAVDRGFWAWSSIGLKNPVASNGVHREPARPSAGPGPGNEAAGAGVTAPPANSSETEAGEMYNNAQTAETQRTAPDPETPGGDLEWSQEQPHKKQRRRFILAYVFIGLGVLALVNNLFPSLMIERAWRLAGMPLILITLGLIILFRNLDGRKGEERGE